MDDEVAEHIQFDWIGFDSIQFDSRIQGTTVLLGLAGLRRLLDDSVVS